MKRARGIEKMKSKYGRLFVLPWEIGMVLFVLIPVIQSVWYSFSDISTTDTGIITKFVGIKNYVTILEKDPFYLQYITDSVIEMLYSIPSIVVLSMIIGIILSAKFKGRLFFRMLYFLPVIIATGSVMEWIQLCTDPSLASAGVSAVESSNMIDISEVMAMLGLEGTLVNYFQMAISKIFDLVWASGIQILLVIAGMQSIPDSMYEVSKIEGATKWEEFWFVTFPMLSRTTVLVIVFTTVELMTKKTNKIMNYVYTLMSTLNYDESSAMLWLYLLFSSTLLGLVVLLFYKWCIKKWE